MKELGAGTSSGGLLTVGEVADLVGVDPRRIYELIDAGQLPRAREALRQLAERHGLPRPRVDAVGTVVVHTDDPGYGQLRSYPTASAKMVGVWVNVITDDSRVAQVDTEAL